MAFRDYRCEPGAVMGIPKDDWLTLFWISQWIISIGAFFYVPFRRSPDAANGWLLLFFVAPWPALLIYAFIGRATRPKWRRQRAAALLELVERARSQASHAFPGDDCGLPAQLVATADLGAAIGRLPPVSGNRIELESDYQRMIVRLAADIDAASDHVHLLFYIFADDATGDQILSALARAAARGVACRLLIDAYGSGPWRRAIARRLARSGVVLQLILPFRLLDRATRADMRNHRKIAVIDGRIGWVGSQNIIDPGSDATKPHRELMARVSGPVVAELQIVFMADWYLETEETLDDPALFPANQPIPGGGMAQVAASGPDYPHSRIDMLFIDLIAAAHERVVLTTPYFIPSEPLIFALRSAALRGVSVQVIVSAVTDSRFVFLAQDSYFADLLQVGVRISLCEINFLHAKHASVDDAMALIGSSNLDMRSFELNSEISLITYDCEVVLRLHEIERQYLERSRSLDVVSWGRRNLARKVAGNVARLFSPLL